MSHCCYFKILSFFIFFLNLNTFIYWRLDTVIVYLRQESVLLPQCRIQGSNSLSSGLAASTFTRWDNSPAPKSVLFNWRVGPKSEFYLVTPPGRSWTHCPPASASQVLEWQVCTPPLAPVCCFVLPEYGCKPQSRTWPVASVPLEV